VSQLARRPTARPASSIEADGPALLPRRRGTVRRRGWLVRRLLLLADVLGLSMSFLLTELLRGGGGGAVGNTFGLEEEVLLFTVTLPVWVVIATLYGLYDRDEERTDHTTVDDFAGVFHLVTICTWLLFAGAAVTGAAALDWTKLLTFWMLAIVLVPLARIGARALARRSATYLQNTLILGAGDVGQLAARKLLSHPEYGINLVGFVDADPKELRPGIEHLSVLGKPGDLAELVERHRIERVVVAFSKDSSEVTLALARSLRNLDVQIDVVPRLFELVGPRLNLHSIEGLQLMGLPPVRMRRSSRLLKRAIDVAVSASLLVVLAPLLAFLAWRIRRESPGPVLFRQTRLGMNMKEFTALKFRTMHVDTGDDEHRAYIRSTMDWRTAPNGNGLYKLERRDCVTKTGRWLRNTSLDELPQLINVLRGEMSLVGPRPCLPWEPEHFAPHHFDRFLVPAGLTGLWQVKARAHATFGEALEMDAAYARGWSFGLDLRLLCLTPLQLLRPKTTL
jgi:exopolysaccharide biosynthesis polyprenyl glycosylphosphotransferase